MCCKVVLDNNRGYKWYSAITDKKSVWAKGFVIYEDRIYKGEELCSLIINFDCDKLKEALALVDGQFSIVIKEESSAIAFVDHMRSFPILLQKNDSEYIITDSVDEKSIKSGNIDDLQKEFLLNALFTFNDNTLYSDVKQIPAGAFLEIENNEYKIEDYWRFSYSENQITDIEKATQSISAGYDELFTRCKELIGSRTVVIPLSGGYDSRLVLNGLLKVGIPKESIIAFTYGQENYEDAGLSKKVAESVGIRHYFINYVTREGEKFFKSEFKDFSFYASNYTSVPCLQEWYAVCKLKEMGVINESCVFVPGYGGILPGHYINEGLLASDNNTREYTKKEIKKFLINATKPQEKVVDNLAEIIMNSKYFLNEKNYLQGLERFVYSEEQAKFIQNAARDYEYVGCEWLSPFFFKQQFNVWGSICNELRLHNKAFMTCMDTYFCETLGGIEFAGSKVRKQAKKRTVFSKISVRLKYFFCRRKMHYLFSIIPTGVYFNHFMHNSFAVSINHLIGCQLLKRIIKK